MDVVSFSRECSESCGVSVPIGVPVPEGVAEADGVGAMPRISSMDSADLEAKLLA